MLRNLKCLGTKKANKDTKSKNGKRKIESGKLKAENWKRKIENGKIENGKIDVESERNWLKKVKIIFRNRTHNSGLAQ